jgi:hypothetical protein
MGRIRIHPVLAPKGVNALLIDAHCHRYRLETQLSFEETMLITESLP